MKKHDTPDYPLLTAFGIAFFVLYIIQYTDGIFGIKNGNFPQLMLCAAVFSGMFWKDKAGAIFGFFIGSFVDAVSANSVCYNSIVMLLLGYISGLLVTHILNNNLRSAIIIFIASAAVYYFGRWCVSGFNVYILKTSLLKSMFLTVFFSIPFYLLMNYIIKRRNKQLQMKQ